MTRIYPTATLRHLLQRKLLSNAIRSLNLDVEQIKPLLHKLSSTPDGVAIEEFDPSLLEKLFSLYLVKRTFATADLPFVFVKAINFELTYGCNLSCSHCLQDALHHNSKYDWVPAAAIIRTMQDAEWMGLVSYGVNFTGGETFRIGSPILELIGAARDMDIPVRANTNAWWGGQSHIQIGNHVFSSDEDVINTLKELKLGRLALSLDDRYVKYPYLIDRVVRVVHLCERFGLSCEFVATEPSPAIFASVVKKLCQSLGYYPKNLFITPMEVVDIGGGALQNKDYLEPMTLDTLAQSSPCGTLGFYRPSILHVAPDGGIRSCMYAPGGGWLGNIIHQRLPEILNSVSDNPVYQLYKSNRLASFVDKYITPFQHLYKRVNHSCAVSALIARIAEEIHRNEQVLKRSLTEVEIEKLHLDIGTKYHLASSPLKIC